MAIDIRGEATYATAPCGVAVVERTENIIVAQNGDSGGPVYALYPGGLQPRGMIAYIYTGDYRVACPQDCSRKVAYTPIDDIMSYWNVHLY